MQQGQDYAMTDNNGPTNFTGRQQIQMRNLSDSCHCSGSEKPQNYKYVCMNIPIQDNKNSYELVRQLGRQVGICVSFILEFSVVRCFLVGSDVVDRSGGISYKVNLSLCHQPLQSLQQFKSFRLNKSKGPSGRCRTILRM